MRFPIAGFVLASIILSCTAQKKSAVTPDGTIDNLRAHIIYLADDKLEGRRAGTPGEALAMKYISDQFAAIGIEAKGLNGYLQPFEIIEGKQINPASSFSINNILLDPARDYFIFPYSANQKLEAIPSIALQESDMPWFVDLKDQLEENKSNPHYDLQEYIRTHSKKAMERGASAVILYNTSSIDDKLVFDPRDRTETLKIPVVYVSKAAAVKYFSDPSASVTIKVQTDIGLKKRTGHNVIGYINNNAPKTVILGAHFDHLGYGEDGNSRNTAHTREIHNGADDNASGTAALIELARKIKTSQLKGSNYVFVAFSGEELGLYGSKYFTDNPTVTLSDVSYMINMDMVGRLNDSTKVLTVGGVGTSPAWANIFTPTQDQSDVRRAFNIKYDSSGTGPSDHTSFYRKDIPVLFFFTGLHTDYHKPSDDAERINYTGANTIVNYIYDIVNRLDNEKKLAFTKTREAQTTTTARFSVSLGIMPDYTYAGTGVRADGVTEGRPAAKAGIKTGDIILQLGDYAISSMESYMQSLGKFKKGDKTKVIYKRGNETLEAIVEF